jgi:hypothetical protein
MNLNFSVAKQRNTLGILMILFFGLICFLFWRLATIASNNQESQLVANADKVSRAQADAQIDSIQKTWEARLANKESELERFKEMVSKRGSETVALVQTKLVYRDTGSVKTVIEYKDSVRTEVVFDYYEFKGEKHDEWIDLEMTANCDSFTYDLQTRDSILVLFRSEKQGFLKPKKTTAYLYSQSPYTISNTQAFQSVVLPQRPGLLVRLYRAIFNGK